MEIAKQPKPKLMNIKIEKLHPFENHPYKVLDDSSMTELVESIKEYGLLNRIIVRPMDDTPEEYEIISGHRRVHAAELLEMKEVPAVVHFIDRDEATVMMVDSNCQREKLTFMEKARSYRMKLDALSHQGKSLGQNVPKSEDNRTTAKISITSYVQTTRWITEVSAPADTMSEQMLLSRLLCLSFTEWRNSLNRTKKPLPSCLPKRLTRNY